MKPLFRKRHTAPAETVATQDEAALKAAYQQGRKDERAERRRSPILAAALVAVALVGGTSLVLAAKEGSFREGGAMMDAGVSTAASEAVPALKAGARQARDGLQDVQDNLSSDQPG
jgi:hypothetical protein